MAIIGTVDADGSPHLAPVGSLRAMAPHELRFGCDRAHQTFANLARDPRVAISLLLPPDLALTIQGRVRVVREHMEASAKDAVLSVEVERVKDDWVAGLRLETAITYRVSDEMNAYLERYLAEVDSA